MGKLLFDTIKKIKPLDKNRMEEKEKENKEAPEEE